MSKTYNYAPDLEDVLDQIEMLTAGHSECDCHWCGTWSDIVNIMNWIVKREGAE